MPDPIQVERKFQELIEHFDSTLSIRHRYHLFRNFIENLEGSLKKFESYILQIVDELPEYTEPLTWTGIDPEQIEQDLALLYTVDSELQLSEKSENFEGVCNRLREVCILLYGCLNDVRGVYHLKRLMGISGPGDKDLSADEKVLDLLRNQIIEKLQNQNELPGEKKEQWQRILRQIKDIQANEDWKALVPVVERNYQEYSEGYGYGRLRKISVEQYSGTENEDELVWNMHVYGATNPSLKEKKDVLIAARNLFESTAGKRNMNYYRGGVNFEFQHAYHVGDSANLAISALWFTRLLEVSHQREVYKLHSHSVITGNVDNKGNVLPVDRESVGLKVQAAFFSWGKILVVPEAQRSLFEKELADLREKYPTRDLVLYGVNHLREIFFDRRLASHNVERHLSFYFKQVKSHKYRAVTVPLIIVLFGVIGWLIFGPVDQNPVSAEFEGEHMILMNQYGQEIHSLNVGEMIVNSVKRGVEWGRKNKVAYKDLNNDGINEVFYTKNLNSRNEMRQDELAAYSITGDSLIWEKALKFDLQFPNKPSIGEDGYRIFNINFVNSGSKSQSFIILNIANYNFFPGMLLKIDPNTGEELARYIHTGIIYQILTNDVNGDERDEIIGFGVNNAFDQATVAFLLDLNSMNGYSPLDEEYRLNGYQQAEEIQYVQFPRSIVGDIFRNRFMNNSPYYIQIDEDEETILFRVYDFVIREPTQFEKPDASLFFYFNYNFEIQSITSDSNYDLWAKNLYEDGIIPFEPDHEYFESFKDSVLYWDGEGFVCRQNN